MSAYERLAAAVLVAHQRRDMSSCLCGWSELGRSHAEHVASVLADAGALNVPPAFRDTYACDPGLEQVVRERDEVTATADRYREALENIAGGRWNVNKGRTDTARTYARKVLDGGTP